MSALIGTSAFSEEWLLATLRASDPEFSAVSGVKSVEEISGGKGFCSKVYLCDVGASAVVLKVPECGKLNEVCAPEEEEAADKEAIPDIVLSHNRECQFYDDFGHLNLITLPKMFKTGKFESKKPGFLLMESLAGVGALDELVSGFNKHQLLAMARDIGRFQAHFLRREERSWVQRFDKSLGAKIMPVIVGLFDKLKSMNEDLFAEGVDRMKADLGNPDFYNHVAFHAYRKAGVPPVLVHGNLWTNNIFWKLNADGSVSNEVAAYIDWQLTHSADVRRQYTDQVLKEYYSTLTEELHGEVPFTFDQVEEMFKVNFINQCWNLMFAVVFQPAMCATLSAPVRAAQLVQFSNRAKLAIDDCLPPF